MTPQQRSACMFVKCMADHIDAKEGRAPSRETRQRVARDVRAQFFEERPMKKIIIGLTGLAGAGKSTAARFLSEEHGFTVLPFTGPLKRMALAYGLTPEEIGPCKEKPFARALPPMSFDLAHAMLRKLSFNAFHHSGEPDGRKCISSLTNWDAACALFDWWHTNRDDFTTPRRFLQLLGTEWGRAKIGQEFWVECWQAEAAGVSADIIGGPITGQHLFVSDDCRFENEAAAIRAEGGIVVRIERAGSGSATGAGHASEAGVVPDVTIINDGSPEMLRARLFGAMDRHFNYEWREIPPVPDWVPLSSLAG